MANLTVAIDDDVLHRARLRALENHTSVNALVRSYLESYAADDAAAARRTVLEPAHRHAADRGFSGRGWTRTSCTIVRAFVDTNVLVHLVDTGDPAAAQRARRTLDDDSLTPIVSAQVLGELSVTLTGKLRPALPVSVAVDFVSAVGAWSTVPIDRQLVGSVITTSERHRLSYWDALILEAAVAGGCDRLLTEDLDAGSVLRGVEIVNPFAA